MGYHQKILDMLYDAIANLGPDDRIVLFFLPFVCRARGWFLPKDTDRAARQRWLQNRPAVRVFAQAVPRASTSRWMSAIVSLKFHAPHNGDRLFIIALLCCFEGLDLPLCGLIDALPEKFRVQYEKACAATAVVEPSPELGAASSSSTAPAPVKSPAAIRKEVQDEKSKMLQASKGTLHVAGKYLSDFDLVNDSNMILVFGTPVQ